MIDEDLQKLGDLLVGLPTSVKNEIAGDIGHKIMESLAGFPVDVVLGVSVNIMANAIGAAVKSEENIDHLIDKIAEQVKPMAHKLYPEYKHVRNQDGSKDT